MSFNKITNGLINATNFPGSSLPAWLNAVVGGNGTVAVSGNLCTCTTAAYTDYAYIVKTVALNDALPWVVRIKTKVTSVGESVVCVAGVNDIDSVPAANLAWSSPPCRCQISNGAGHGGRFYWSVSAANAPANYEDDNYWLYEITSDGAGNKKMVGRNPSTIAAIDTYSNVVTYTYLPFVLVGDLRSVYDYNTITVAYMSIFSSLNITIGSAGKTVEDGYIVKLYNSSDTLLATSAAASDGTAIMDCTLVDFGGTGITGYFKVFQGDGATLVRRLPAIGNADDAIWGGDVWAGTAIISPTVISCAPSSGFNNTSVSITDLEGTGFASGATVALKKIGQFDIDCTSVNVDSPTKIDCIAPITGAIVGTWDINVTNTDTGNGTLSNGFTVTETMTYTEISKVNLSKTQTQTINSSARITNLQEKSLAVRANVKNTEVAILDSQSNIQSTFNYLLATKANVKNTEVAILDSQSNIQSTFNYLLAARANIAQLFDVYIFESGILHGTVSPLGHVSVNYNSDLTVTCSPDEGHSTRILVDGVYNYYGVTIYTMHNVVANHTLEVSWYSSEGGVAYPKVANVTWSGTGVVSGKYMVFNPDETKWVVLGELLESFMDSDGNLPSNFTVNDIVDPDNGE